MVKDLSYGTINNVMENWEAVKRIKDCETAAGLKLFQRYVKDCEREPAKNGWCRPVSR